MSFQFPIKAFEKLIDKNDKASTRKTSRQSRMKIYKDYVIDPKTSHNLYLIRHGMQQAENVIDGNQKNFGKKGVVVDEGSAAKTVTSKMADDLLRRLNVTVSSIPKEHTLLHCQFDKPDEENPNIFDKKDFQDTKNEKISIVDNFPDKDNPIYNLDTTNQDHNSFYNVQKEINRTPNKDANSPNENNYNNREGQVLRTPDMTFIAASVVYLNFTNTFSGQVKYFTQVNNPLSERKPNDKVIGGLTVTQEESDKRRYGTPIERNPYDTINPNKEDYHAAMITSDLKRSGKNVGIYVQGARFIERDTSSDNLRRNIAGLQSDPRRRIDSSKMKATPTEPQGGSGQGGY